MHFSALDKDGNGSLTVEEMKHGLKEEGASDEEIEAMLDESFPDALDYTEFLAAGLHSENLLEEPGCREAFRIFNRDGSGKISKAELRSMLLKP
jgi:calcium-dependent protein kinase